MAQGQGHSPYNIVKYSAHSNVNSDYSCEAAIEYLLAHSTISRTRSSEVKGLVWEYFQGLLGKENQ